MIVTLNKNRLIIQPETDFETDWLNQHYGCDDKEITGFVKHGVTAADTVGLVVEVTGKRDPIPEPTQVKTCSTCECGPFQQDTGMCIGCTSKKSHWVRKGDTSGCA